MRKNRLIAAGLILGVSFMALPALADYNETSTWSNQLDNTANAPDFAAIGALADENPNYGPGTIYIPYIGGPYDMAGCNNTVVDMAGNPIGTGYNCAPGDTGDNPFNEVEPLIIQDLFGAVIEGNVNKEPSAQGIHQYLDSLFVFDADLIYVDQTLDQDLADMTLGGGSFGIWQRLHSSVDITGASLGHGVPNSTYGLDSTLRSIDQTVEAFVSDRHPASLPGDLGNVVYSYMGQWFQANANVTCETQGLPCHHNEFGGHGTVSSSTYSPDITAHDP